MIRFIGFVLIMLSCFMPVCCQYTMTSGPDWVRLSEIKGMNPFGVPAAFIMLSVLLLMTGLCMVASNDRR